VEISLFAHVEEDCIVLHLVLALWLTKVLVGHESLEFECTDVKSRHKRISICGC